MLPGATQLPSRDERLLREALGQEMRLKLLPKTTLLLPSSPALRGERPPLLLEKPMSPANGARLLLLTELALTESHLTELAFRPRPIHFLVSIHLGWDLLHLHLPSMHLAK